MQINFNPHVPPGYLETHELEGVSWRSERPVRKVLTERAVAMVARRFDLEYRSEMERQSRESNCGAVEKRYRAGGVDLLLIRYPWESMPLVMVDVGGTREQE